MIRFMGHALLMLMLVLIGLMATTTTQAHAGWKTERATWYGPGFYGKTTRCGHVYTGQIRGIAVDRMKCGTKLTICRRGTCVRVRVIDGGGAFDLSARTAQDLCRCWAPYTMNVRWRRGWVH